MRRHALPVVFVGLVIVLAGCSSGDTADDETTTTTAPADTTTTAPSSSSTAVTVADDGSAEVGAHLVGDDAGAFTAHVPSDGAPGVGVAVRVFHPARDAVRYPEGAPIVVLPAYGGFDTGGLSGEGPHPSASSGGFIRVEILLPGGKAVDGTVSGGTDDIRGPDAVQATVDVLEYVAGTRPDTDGLFLSDRVEYGLVSNIGIWAYSNSGNLAVVALAEADPTQAPVAWLVTDESPFGDQAGSGALNANPFFEPGTCDLATCPWPGLGDALVYDPDKSTVNLAGGPSWPGRFTATGGDDSVTAGSIDFKALPGPPGSDKAFVSTELLAEILAHEDTLFGTGGPPAWLPSASETEEFWHFHNGAARIADASASYPDLLVCAVQRQRDHRQSSPDYPHTWVEMLGWSDAGHAFYRLNPDSAYTAATTGMDAKDLPDNDAGTLVPWPDPLPAMIPNQAQAAVNAALFEMMDRAWSGDTSNNLAAVIHP